MAGKTQKKKQRINEECPDVSAEAIMKKFIYLCND